MSRRAGVRTRSLRARVLLALGATLTVATVISLLVDVRVTGSRLDDEGARLLEDNLRIAAQFLTDQRAQREIALARPFVWSKPGPGSFSTFLDDWLGADGPSLRGDWSNARSATRDRLLAAVSSARSVYQSADAHLATELVEINSARTVFGRPPLRFPPGGAGHFLDAVDLRDHHLHLGDHNATPVAQVAP